MILHRLKSAIDRIGRNEVNENFDRIESSYKKVIDDSSEAKTIAQGIDGKATQALNTANQANTKSDNAVSIATEKGDEAINIVTAKGNEAVNIAKQKGDESVSIATQKGNEAIDIANQANNTSNYVQQQLDTVILESGDANPEVIQARAEFVNLRDRLDTEFGQVTTKLAQSFDKTSVVAPQTRRKMKGGVLLVDDDLHPNAYTTIFNQIVKGRNIPYMFAAIPSRIESGAIGSINYTQFKEMQSHPLVTMANHTNTHPNLSTLTEQQIVDEISIAEEWLRKEGVYTRCLVPPFGGINDNVRKHIKKYCDTILITYGTGGTADLNCPDGAMLNSDAVRRVEFSLPLVDLKALADLAKTHNALMVVSTHAGYSPNESNVQNFVIQKLHDFIDYCDSIDLPFLSYDEAYEMFKNVIEHRDEKGTLLAGVSANGESFGLTSKDFYVSSKLKYASDAPVYANGPQLSLVKRSYNTANATLYGYPGAGQLLTSVGGDYGYTFELYQPLRTTKLLFRAYNDQTATWSEFVDLTSTLNLRGTLTFGANQHASLSTGTSTRITITANGVKPGDSVIVNPNGHILPAGVIVGAPYVQTNDQIIIPILNMSSQEYSVNGTSWLWRVIRNV